MKGTKNLQMTLEEYTTIGRPQGQTGVDYPDWGRKKSPKQDLGTEQTSPVSHPPQETEKYRKRRNKTKNMKVMGKKTQIKGSARKARRQKVMECPDQGLRSSPEQDLGTKQISLESHSPQRTVKHREREDRTEDMETLGETTQSNSNARGAKRQKVMERPDQGLKTSPEQDLEEVDSSWACGSLTAVKPKREAAETEIERLVRRTAASGEGARTIEGLMKRHVIQIIKSRAAEKVIGLERGAKIWGWLAKANREGKVPGIDQWISQVEHRINEIRADAAWAETQQQARKLSAAADREEALGSVRTWLKLNEEPTRQGFQVLREEKRETMRSSRSNFFKRMGGAEAMYATIALLTHSGEVVLETDRGAGGVREANQTWLRRSMLFAAAIDWIREEDTERYIEEAMDRQTRMRQDAQPREGQGTWKILDVGEGWGSIGIAVAGIPGCATVGLDRVGFVDQGMKLGKITSRLNLDLSTVGRTNVLRKAAKLASRSLESFLMVWLSPECRILTAANAINVARGCTNGRMLQDPRNSEMEEEMRTVKEEEYRQCKQAIANQVLALDQETDKVLFAMENPARSDLWEMAWVKEMMKKNINRWRLVTVDQCAYGRKCKKPTKILTNIKGWIPKGMTGTGRCIVLKCGGTCGNAKGPGQGRHEQQMIAKDPKRKPREGKIIEGNRREYSIKAGKNLVQAQLVKEIVEAAIAEADMSHVNAKKRRRIIKEEGRGNQAARGGVE